MLALRCAHCGHAFHRRAYRGRRRSPDFCSRLCARRFYKGKLHPQYRGGAAPPLPADWEARAERVRARDGHRCRLCGKTQAENGRTLSVDHIKPRRCFENPMDADREENLASACDACHGRKTARAERSWLRGDTLEYRHYADTVRPV